MATINSRAPRRRLPVAIIVLAAVASGACTKVQELFGSASNKASTTTSDSAATVQQAGTSITTELGLARPASAAAGKVRGRESGSGKQAASRKPAPAGGAPSTEAQPAISSSAIAGAATSVSAPPALEPEPASATARAESPAASPALAAKPLSAVNGPIYSQDDPDVTPARLLTTREGNPLFRGMVSDMNTMEMVISEQGRVEQVRLLTPAKRMTDLLLLSGAKTWKFAPATRDGQPVRYRTMFSWPSVP
ncbi:MAG TPA: hypothetical protein VFV95_01775 [Vicinamibacterales bacterium]|nr:hypothetical protein [Vicinamibacterales bacterium]